MEQITIKESDIKNRIINETDPILLLNNNFYDHVRYDDDLYTIIQTITSKDLTEFKMYIVFQDVFQDDNKQINDSIYIEWDRTGCGLKKIQIYIDTSIEHVIEDYNFFSLTIYNKSASGRGSLIIAMKKDNDNKKIIYKWYKYLQAAQTLLKKKKNLPIENRFAYFKRLLLPQQPQGIDVMGASTKVDEDDDDWDEVEDEDEGEGEGEGGKLRKQRKSKHGENQKKRKSRKSRKQRKSKTRRKSRKRR